MPLHQRQRWLQKVTGAKGARQIGEQLGYSHTTVLRWIRSGVPADVVMDIAARAAADILGALVEVGWIDEAGVTHLLEHVSLERVPQHRLTEELHRRALKEAA